MRYIFILILFLSPIFSQTKEEALHDAKIKQEARAELLLELQEKNRKNNLLKPTKAQAKQFSKIGLSIDKNLIILDTNKTTAFFKNFVNSLEDRFKEIQSSLIDPKKAGIDIDSEHINIDINTSKRYLEKLEKTMQGFVKEFDNIAKEFN